MSYISKNLSPWFASLVKAVISMLVYLVPLYLAQHAQVADMSVSTIVLWGLHYLDSKYGS